MRSPGHLRDVERIGVVPAGERWGDGSLRPAYEDLVGAGAVVDRLAEQDPGLRLTPEAEAAALAFRALRPLEQCPSGAELVEKGYAEDVRIAGEVDVTDAASPSSSRAASSQPRGIAAARASGASSAPD